MNVLKKLPFSFYIILVFVLCQTGIATQMALSIRHMEELQPITGEEMHRFLTINSEDGNAIDENSNPENRDALSDLVSMRWVEQSALILAKWDDLNTAYRSTIVTYIFTSITCSLILLLFYWIYTKKFTFLRLSNSTLRRNNIDLQGDRTAQGDALSRRLLAMSEQEKATLARELHDELGSNLMIIRINLATALDTFGQNDPVLAEHLRDALQLLKKTVEIKRRIVENLRPSMLESFGLATTLRSYCVEIRERTGLQIDIRINGDFAQLESERSIALYRIVQESLTNTIKYAKATHVSISLNQLKYGVRLHISDNGVGITSEMLKNPKSHGILGMRERAVLNGGSFTIFPSKAGCGTHIDVFIPCVDTVTSGQLK